MSRRWTAVNELHGVAADLVASNRHDGFADALSLQRFRPESRAWARAAFDRLICEDTMRPAWQQLLTSARPFWREESMLPLLAWQFLSACSHALSDYDGVPQRAPAAHRQHYEAVETMALTLAKTIEGDLGLSESSGHISWTDYDALGERLGALLDEKCLLRDLDVSARESILAKLVLEALHFIPRTAEQLELVAAVARSAIECGPMAARPSEPTAARTYFIRSLAQRSMHLTGGVILYETIASAASAVFQETVDAELVRKLIWRRRVEQRNEVKK